MNSLVAKETPILIDAILQSGPAEIIRAACERNLHAPIFIKADGGFVGGDMLNVVTASLAHLRMNPEEPMLDSPLTLPEPPQSFICKLASGILAPNDAEVEETGDMIDVPSSEAGQHHFCLTAEKNFKLDATNQEFPYYEDEPEATINNLKGISLYRKANGPPSSLVLDERGIKINGVWLPPGIVGYRDVYRSAPVFYEGDYRYVSSFDIRQFDPCRLTAFPVPMEERVETFTPPPGFTKFGLREKNLMAFPSLDVLRDALHKRVVEPIEPLLDKAEASAAAQP